MSGAPSHQYGHWGKWYNATRKQDSQKRSTASDYSMLLKHEDDAQRVTCDEPALTPEPSFLPELQIIFTKPLLPQAGINSLRLPDDAFKRYCLLRVFLV